MHCSWIINDTVALKKYVKQRKTHLAEKWNCSIGAHEVQDLKIWYYMVFSLELLMDFKFHIVPTLTLTNPLLLWNTISADGGQVIISTCCAGLQQ
jgi:hypothetical protein